MMDSMEKLLKRIARGERGGFQKFLDWERRILRVNGIEFGGYVRNETQWGWLASLASAKPLKPGLADTGEGVIAADHSVCKRAKARNVRREISRALPKGMLKLFVQAVRGRGHRLASDVRVPGKSEVGLVRSDSEDVFENIVASACDGDETGDETDEDSDVHE